MLLTSGCMHGAVCKPVSRERNGGIQVDNTLHLATRKKNFTACDLVVYLSRREKLDVMFLLTDFTHIQRWAWPCNDRTRGEWNSSHDHVYEKRSHSVCVFACVRVRERERTCALLLNITASLQVFDLPHVSV